MGSRTYTYEVYFLSSTVGDFLVRVLHTIYNVGMLDIGANQPQLLMVTFMEAKWNIS